MTAKDLSLANFIIFPKFLFAGGAADDQHGVKREGISGDQ